MQGRASGHDQDATFPQAEIAALRRAGALSPDLPARHAARDDKRADALAAVLMFAGQGNLSVGRIVEAHVNALHLIARFGTPAQQQDAEAVIDDDALFALWVTDDPAAPVRIIRDRGAARLTGRKQFCSAAGHATHALITARDGDGTRMIVQPLGGGEVVAALSAPLAGMRASVTGAADFTGCTLTERACLGQPGDYLREPDFSAGAWRASAVAAGGLMAIVDAAIETLRGSHRIESPHAKARLGEIMIARETTRLWARRMACCAEDPTTDADLRVATVGLGRIAIEMACLDAIRHVQRSIGLSSFRSGSAIERMCRDLSTYLRQPAPDEVLTEAAEWFARHPNAVAT
jgi:alkylation response protein AidB-like acyl-CoA dehydrogenase